MSEEHALSAVGAGHADWPTEHPAMLLAIVVIPRVVVALVWAWRRLRMLCSDARIATPHEEAVERIRAVCLASIVTPWFRCRSTRLRQPPP